MKQDGKSRQQHGAPVEEPHVGTRPGKPLDGSQYVDVIEEQLYSERRPTLDAREPHEQHQPHKEEQSQRSQVASPQNTPTGN
jgi:hypothetical protein